MNSNSEFRTNTSAFTEVARIVKDLSSKRSESYDLYKDLLENTVALQNSSNDLSEEKSRILHMKIILENLREQYWEIQDMLEELDGAEVIDVGELPSQGISILKELISLLDDFEPKLKNAIKAWDSRDDLDIISDLCLLCENKQFTTLYDTLEKTEQKMTKAMPKLKSLKQKRIL